MVSEFCSLITLAILNKSSSKPRSVENLLKIILLSSTYISTTSDLLKALNLAYTYSSAVSDGSEWWYEY